MIDISIKEQLEQYLLDKKIVNKEDGYSFKYCKGGVSGTVAFVFAGDKELICLLYTSSTEISQF